MGTDIYLYWDGMLEDEKEKQLTGFSIAAGNVGYLRASIGMFNENKVLRAIFPDSYWAHDGDGNGIEYDFIDNISMIKPILKNYLYGNDIDVGDRCDSQQRMLKVIQQLFSSSEADVDVSISSNNTADGADGRWALSVFEFCMLGVELQYKGKKPRVYISW